MQGLQRHDELERAISSRPGERSAYASYGTWLTSQGDPHGELIALECALADTPDDESLLRLRNDVLSRHRETLLASHPALTVERTAFGLLRAMRIRAWNPHDLVDAVDAIARSKMARLLQELRIVIGYDLGPAAPRVCEDQQYDGPLARISESDTFAMLSTLELVCDNYPLISVHVEPIPSSFAKLVELTSLRLRVGHVRGLESTALPKLTSLDIDLAFIRGENVRSVGEASFPSLERLAMGGNSDDGITSTDTRALFEARGLPRLRSFAIRSMGEPQPFIQSLAASRLVSQLESLDIQCVHFWSNDEARALLAAAPALKHLRSLALGAVDTTPETLDALHTLCPHVTVRPRPPPPMMTFNPPPPRRYPG